MRKLFYSIAVASLAVMAACSGQKESAPEGGDFTLTVPVAADAEGHMVYLTNYDTDTRVDSAIVTAGVAKFTSHVDTAYMGRLYLDGKRIGMAVIEPGDIVIDSNRVATGTPTNDSWAAYNNANDSLMKAYRCWKTNDTVADTVRNAQMEAIEAAAMTLKAKALADNNGNPLGLYLFISDAYDLSLEQMDSAFKTNPIYAQSARLQSLRQGLITKQQTSPGHKFVDFEIVNNSDTLRLSDHVGRGHYTLVDFWASWCGPCIRETETIKRIYASYPDSTLEVLGIAVWDEPENTIKAIKDHELPWGQIINTQKVATDAYGIPAIPCIILFDPEGTIVARDLTGEELETAVKVALAPNAE
ncbi:MAG: AhpC/TSA family protein [Pseudoflavonifractor sp.]|nr:AhpC/TSA family protein [Alloprevotella sp.]MCM1117310.1 AhpC/TSA family protein [Pseudoflavonifractor sp.]